MKYIFPFAVCCLIKPLNREKLFQHMGVFHVQSECFPCVTAAEFILFSVSETAHGAGTKPALPVSNSTCTSRGALRLNNTEVLIRPGFKSFRPLIPSASFTNASHKQHTMSKADHCLYLSPAHKLHHVCSPLIRFDPETEDDNKWQLVNEREQFWDVIFF